MSFSGLTHTRDRGREALSKLCVLYAQPDLLYIWLSLWYKNVLGTEIIASGLKSNLFWFFQINGERLTPGEQRVDSNFWSKDMSLYRWTISGHVSLVLWPWSFRFHIYCLCVFIAVFFFFCPHVYHRRPHWAEVSGPLKSCLDRQTFLPHEYTQLHRCKRKYMHTHAVHWHTHTHSNMYWNE